MLLILSRILLFIACVLLIFTIYTGRKMFRDLELLEQKLKQRKIDADTEYDSWGR